MSKNERQLIDTAGIVTIETLAQIKERNRCIAVLEEQIEMNIQQIAQLPDSDLAGQVECHEAIETLNQAIAAIKEDGCDHEWEFIDDSFDHEYGCEQIHYRKCRLCYLQVHASDFDESDDIDRP